MLTVLHISNGDDCLGSAKCLYDILSYETSQQDIKPIVLTPFQNKMNEFCNKLNIENYAKYGFGLWAVCLKENGRLIGDCGLTMQDINGSIRPEIGYHIRRDMQRRGYAKEAACAVCGWAFDNTPFRVLYSYMKHENVPSAKTAMSYGARFAESSFIR